MKNKLIFIGIIGILTLVSSAAADCPYGNMEVYFNNNILPGEEIAKPLLKIGEPFTIGIKLTVYQKSEVSIELSEIGSGYFKIINGSTSTLNVYRADVMEKNSTRFYEWIVVPTEKWAGGSLPIDIVYQIDDFETKDSLVQGGFTVAYCTISNEYYEGKVPSPATSPSESSPSSNSTSSESIPAFTILAAVFALTLISFRR
ncbi:MAG: sarcinarray family MAST domain-containing protein [Methanosarcinaceae archaeon]|nr:sarcinarray family MAST domain-containing protein [Methanosarcinaceae archaeon]